MKNFLIAFVVFMVWSIFGLWIYSWLQPKTDSAKLKPDIIENNQIEESISNKLPVKKINTDSILNNSKNSTPTKDTLSTLKNEPNIGLKATNNSGDIIFVFSEGITIKKNKIETIIPPSVIDYKYIINTYLLEHPEQELHINSLYSPKEIIITPNIGIQRAINIYEQLIVLGVPKEKIVIKPIIKNILFNENDGFNNSIYFTFKPLDKYRLALLKESVPKVRTVYPKFSESGIIANNDLKKLLNELKVYFNNNPTKKIDIVGHTDKIGNGMDNYNIGLKYAMQVRWYLISKGKFDKSQLKASSKGEAEPIEDNNTHQGRIANRRIEIIFN